METYLLKHHYKPTLVCLLILATFLFSSSVFAQDSTRYMRIAKIVVDSSQLESYKMALKEQMKSALTLEKGVLVYSAVYDKKHPSHITIFETYASVAGYQAHTQTEHFKKYKAAVQGMVQSLELTDVEPISIAIKEN